MTDPATAVTVVSLAVKFLEGMAGKSGETLTEKLWDAIKSRFAGRKKVEETIAQIEETRDPQAIQKLTTIVDAEMIQDDDFAGEVQQLAQQIINLTQNQTQTQTSMHFEVKDNSKMNAVGELKNTGGGDVVFGDKS
ncbi:MAG TPA: hypothetical protein IGS17_19905 [Oscillatoriales cyanobacterium M59_W2019_021]|nr:MAG: hypothetical protein D6728_14530 [Cyanobacteria bacterium J055]HIK34044.1 hypothetical protein [Oscillatoriales cyanobacterium M4454_W2019_049]HIK53157.1 hypothetical protein [Oscillatoriales cyanobacterium M59_W2019_021]